MNRMWLSVIAVLLAVASALVWMTAAAGNGGPPDLSPALAAQARHTDGLLGNPDVVGTAVGLTDAGEPAVLVFTRRAGAGGIPGALDGVPVVIHVTGEFDALGHSPGHTAATKTRIDPKNRFDRPVPIGVSTGPAGVCLAGSIGFRVRDAAGNVYALSNNHVYANENALPLGTEVLQPGLYDTGCVYDANNKLGNLSDFVPLKFDGATNYVDAAIAVSDEATLGNSTPSNGYGTPKSATASAFVGQKVQKYGRTTSLTSGQVVGVNATINVGYSSGTAKFAQQIVILGGTKPYIRSGDSGSTSVVKGGADDKKPVGLNFASSANGYAIVNPIGLVLGAFNVTVDGT